MARTETSMFSQKIIEATNFCNARKEYEYSRGILGTSSCETDRLQQTHNEVIWNYAFIE
jgi:hypothetical protein